MSTPDDRVDPTGRGHGKQGGQGGNGGHSGHVGHVPVDSRHLDEPTLHAYLDRELPSTDLAIASSHLTECDDCARRLATLRSLFTSLESLPDLAPTRDVSASVVAAIRSRQTAPTPVVRRRLWWLVPQALVALMLLGFALPSLDATWLAWTTGADALPAPASVREVTQAWTALVAGGEDASLRLRTALGQGWESLDESTSAALAPYAGWPAASWAGLLLALIPPWWLANRWLVRVAQPNTMSREHHAV